MGNSNQASSTPHQPTDAPAVPPPQHQPSASDKAVLELKVTRDKLHKQKKKMLKESEKMTLNAKELLKAGKKDKAAMLLKMRRFREAEITRVEGQIANLETMVHDLQRVEMQAKVFESLKAGTEALKQLQELMPIDEVQKLMDENEEALQYSDEISSILAKMNPEDEQRADDDLLAMIRELELPEAPSTVPVIKTPPAAAKVPAATEPKQKDKEPVLA